MPLPLESSATLGQTSQTPTAILSGGLHPIGRSAPEVPASSTVPTTQTATGAASDRAGFPGPPVIISSPGGAPLVLAMLSLSAHLGRHYLLKVISSRPTARTHPAQTWGRGALGWTRPS